MRGNGGGGVRYDQQLLDSRADHGTVDGYADTGVPGPGGGDADGERHESRDGGEFYVVGDGEQRGGRGIGGDDVAVLPVHGRNHHDVRHSGGDGSGSGAGRVGEQQQVSRPDGPGEPRDVLLWGVCGCRGRRVGYDQQLLDVGAGHGAGVRGSTGPDGGGAVGEQQQSGRGGEFHPVDNGKQCRRWGHGGDDVALLPVHGRNHHDV